MVTKRILEVSDDDAIRDMNAVICKHFGLEVVQASTGDEALTLYRKHRRFALVMSDLYYYDKKPEPPFNAKVIRDGIQLAFAIGQLAPEQKIVIHTAARAIKLPRELRNVSVLVKPYAAQQLTAILGQL